ncbi:MAG: lytic transglycosylase domain-containing protein, partial [Methylococcales bacterium]
MVSRRFLIFLVFFSSFGAQADIYKIVERGKVTFTNIPLKKVPRGVEYTLVLKSLIRKQNIDIDELPLMSMKGSVNRSRNRKKFAPLIASAAQRHKVDPKLLHAVILAESAYNPNAVSHKGAVGLMQLMPQTADRYGVRNRQDPNQNINGGAKYLSDLISMFASDIRLAVAAYNAGEQNVIKYGNTIPPFKETQQYVK